MAKDDMAKDDMARDMAKVWSRFRLFAAVIAILVVTAVAHTATADEYKTRQPDRRRRQTA